MNRLVSVFLALFVLMLGAGSALAAGFGTPTLDGLVDGVYGAAEATDQTGDGNGNAVMDLVSLYVCNDNTFWYFLFTVNANVQTTNWGKYILYIDTTNDANGATSDAWGRNVVVSDTHKPEFSLHSWMDNAPYGPEDSQFWAWTTAWAQSGGLDGAARNASTTSGIEWKVLKSRIGDPSTIWVEVFSTGGGTTDNAQDTSNDPAEDWNATDWATQATLLNSTQVARSSGGDTTPPTVISAAIGDNDPGTLLVTFSEPVDPTTSQISTNYTVTGVTVTNAALQTDSTKVLLTLNQDLGYGTCITVRARNVKDRALNTIVDNGTTNVYVLYLTELLVRAHMNVFLRTNSAAPDPDSVGIEGGMAPLTWNPACDDLLGDPDADSVFEGFYTFQHSCTGGTPDSTRLEYKFTHQCITWESVSNHLYDLMGLKARDTLEIWWDNQAPSDFTDKAIDVVFKVRSNTKDLWDRDVDSIGINGSQPPLNWDVPPVSRLKDDGLGGDAAADDGIFSTRITFPTGSLKNVDFKYLWKALPDTVFNYECFEKPNRNVYLNDTLFSTTNPIVMDLAFWDICGDPSGVDGSVPAPERLELLHNVPNPFNPNTAIEFTLPGSGYVDLSVYDVSGRLVRALLQGEMAAGSYTGDRAIRWDGTDNAGKEVRSGVYFYRLKAGAEEMTRKMVLVR